MSQKLQNVRFAIIGVGGMGTAHIHSVKKTQGAILAALCDIDREMIDAKAAEYDVPAYYNHKSLLKDGVCDAVIIATPHYDHTIIGSAALKAGYHVLVEKPISVHKADCEKLIKAHADKKLVFSAMFNQRTDPHYQKLKALIDGGELGELTRINWIITSWFRTQYYYDHGGWRATWNGEGGGVLLNQCPHQLDLLQWLVGMPSKVRGFCQIAKRHHIEVEDEVTAYLEYPNGATGIFVTSTGEAPGTNRLEIIGTKGKVVVEEGKITFTRNLVPMDKFCKTSKEKFARPDVWNIDIPTKDNGGQHAEIIQNFTNAILHGEKLIAPAEEGINSVELGNAMLYSSLTGKPVEMPLSGQKFAKLLKNLIANSTFEKKAVKAKGQTDMSGSF